METPPRGPSKLGSKRPYSTKVENITPEMSIDTKPCILSGNQCTSTDDGYHISKVIAGIDNINNMLDTIDFLTTLEKSRDFIIYPDLSKSCSIQDDSQVKNYQMKCPSSKLSNPIGIFTMEKGVLLLDYIKQTKLEPADKQAIYKSYLACLSYLNNLHRRDILHGDFHRENIVIIPETKQVKLIDFSNFNKTADYTKVVEMEEIAKLTIIVNRSLLTKPITAITNKTTLDTLLITCLEKSNDINNFTVSLDEFTSPKISSIRRGSLFGSPSPSQSPGMPLLKRGLFFASP